MSIRTTRELDVASSTDYKEELKITPEKAKAIRNLFVNHALRVSDDIATAIKNRKSVATEYSDWKFNGTSVNIKFNPDDSKSEPAVRVSRNDFYIDILPDGGTVHNFDEGYSNNFDGWVNTSMRLLQIAEAKEKLTWKETVEPTPSPSVPTEPQ
jgi:hypothetical protein